jgi:hypothetical protein
MIIPLLSIDLKGSKSGATDLTKSSDSSLTKKLEPVQAPNIVGGTSSAYRILADHARSDSLSAADMTRHLPQLTLIKVEGSIPSGPTEVLDRHVSGAATLSEAAARGSG